MSTPAKISNTKWITFLVSLTLLITFIYIYNLRDQVSDLEYKVSELEDKVSNADNENFDLLKQLKECESNMDDYQSNSNYQTNYNWSLEDDNSNLKRKIRDLESALDDCEGKLRNNF